MKIDFGWALVTLVAGIIVGMILFECIDSYNDNLVDNCWKAELSDANVIWQDSTPFCMVKVGVNGEDKLFTAKEYKIYSDLVNQ